MNKEVRFRLKVFVQRLWQPTSACITCMPGGVVKIWGLSHIEIALRTGLVTGLLAVMLSFTPLGRLYKNRYSNALMVGCLTVFGDSYSHPNHFAGRYGEALVTGLVSASLSLLGSFAFEDRGRRIRSLWLRWFA